MQRTRQYHDDSDAEHEPMRHQTQRNQRRRAYRTIAECIFGVILIIVLVAGIINIKMAGSAMMERMDKMTETTHGFVMRMDQAEKQVHEFFANNTGEIAYWKRLVEDIRRKDVVRHSLDFFQSLEEIDIRKSVHNIDASTRMVHERDQQIQRWLQELQASDFAQELVTNVNWTAVLGNATALLRNFKAVDWEGIRAHVSNSLAILEQRSGDINSLVSQGDKALRNFNNVSAEVSEHKIIELVRNSTVHVTRALTYIDVILDNIKRIP